MITEVRLGKGICPKFTKIPKIAKPKSFAAPSCKFPGLANLKFFDEFWGIWGNLEEFGGIYEILHNFGESGGIWGNLANCGRF